MKQSKAHIISSFEPVAFPDFHMDGVTAKIDTGAYTGALHCTKIEEHERAESKVLVFSPFDQPEVVIATQDFTIKYVRSSNGGRNKRYFIETNIVIRGQAYPIVLSLADRSDMRWPVLIGRRFLRHNRFLVDVRRGRKPA